MRTRPAPRPSRRPATRLASAVLTAALTAVALPATTAQAADNPATPGNFTGFGFDQCVAPTQRSMNKWLKHSPFLAVGIYISGDSRGCRSQPNLTPRWVDKQLAKGWRLLPISLGPQASCHPSFPRYSDDESINPRPGKRDRYPRARRQGRREAVTSVEAAQRLGIVRGSTLWYDLEGFDITNRHCRESALAFLSSWVHKVEKLGYVSGTYSSAGSGIKMLDDARVHRPGEFHLPQRIWIARWDGVANTSTSYIRDDGWRPGGRMKQYRGGHQETWGGVTINIDSNFLDLGKGSVAQPESHCGGVRVGFKRYRSLAPAKNNRARHVRALQCLLTESGHYTGRVDGEYDAATIAAARAWQSAHRFSPRDKFAKPHWIALLAAGPREITKFGVTGPAVRRLQRALNAAGKSSRSDVSGVYAGDTQAAVRAYQGRVGLPATGVANPKVWRHLRRGDR